MYICLMIYCVNIQCMYTRHYLLCVWGFSCVIFFFYNKFKLFNIVMIENIHEVIVKTYRLLTFYLLVMFYGFPPNLNQFQNNRRKYASGGQSWHCFCQNFMISLLICWPKQFYCSLLLFTMSRWQLFILAFDYLYSCLCFYDMFTMSIYQ